MFFTAKALATSIAAAAMIAASPAQAQHRGHMSAQFGYGHGHRHANVTIYAGDYDRRDRFERRQDRREYRRAYRRGYRHAVRDHRPFVRYRPVYRQPVVIAPLRGQRIVYGPGYGYRRGTCR